MVTHMDHRYLKSISIPFVIFTFKQVPIEDAYTQALTNIHAHDCHLLANWTARNKPLLYEGHRRTDSTSKLKNLRVL
jgi:hypothetical protein